MLAERIKLNFIKKYYGFTLAEVLITLAIIGIVASLTIPSVVNNYKKTQTTVQLKKVYSALANTTNLAIAEHGPIESWVIVCSGGSGCAHAFVKTYMMPYLKIANDCYDSSNTTKCDYQYYALNSSTPKTWTAASYSTFYLNDGTFIRIWTAASYSTFYLNDGTFIRIWTGGTTTSMAHIYIDLNGKKPPNTWGKDMFIFNYYIKGYGSYDGKMLPDNFTTNRDALTSDCSKDGTGKLCTALIMLDGWKMADDYPW